MRSRSNILTNDWLKVYLMIPALVPYGVFFNTEPPRTNYASLAAASSFFTFRSSSSICCFL